MHKVDGQPISRAAVPCAIRLLSAIARVGPFYIPLGKTRVTRKMGRRTSSMFE